MHIAAHASRIESGLPRRRPTPERVEGISHA
jgi:hypothetical protein